MKKWGAWVDVLYLVVSTYLLLTGRINDHIWGMGFTMVMTARTLKKKDEGSGIVALLLGVGILTQKWW